MLNCLFVGVCGFLGAVARYLCTRLPLAPEGGFPLVTLLINVLGAFVIASSRPARRSTSGGIRVSCCCSRPACAAASRRF